MNIALWSVQGILAAMFVMAGITKSMQPMEKMAKSMAWTTRVPAGMVRFIGISEFLIAIGLVLPWLLNIVPILTPVAAAALVLVMLLAIAHHAKHKESKAIIFNLVILAMAAFVAYGRFVAVK